MAMFPLNSRKDRAVQFVQCLAEGTSIGRVQTVDEMVALAGACFFALMSHGPILRRMAAQMQNQALPESQASEHAEADEEMVFNDLHAAIEFSAHLTMLVHDGGYDQQCEPVVQCLVTQDDGQKRVLPVSGFKQGD
jgi:hypothetical protein